MSSSKNSLSLPFPTIAITDMPAYANNSQIYGLFGNTKLSFESKHLSRSLSINKESSKVARLTLAYILKINHIQR
jgi:hypothetical protein